MTQADSNFAASGSPDGAAIRTLGALVVPWGGQEIELQEIVYSADASPLLRIRIREGRRFTIFDVDSRSAEHWAGIMAAWAASQVADRTPAPAQAGHP